MPTCSWLPCSKPRLMTSLDRSSRPCTAHKPMQILVIITVVCSPGAMGPGCAQSRCRCGRGEPSPGADVAGASHVLAQMWKGWAQPRHRSDSGKPSPGADVAGVGPVPAQMWQSPRRRRAEALQQPGRTRGRERERARQAYAVNEQREEERAERRQRGVDHQRVRCVRNPLGVPASERSSASQARARASVCVCVCVCVWCVWCVYVRVCVRCEIRRRT